MIQTDLSSFSYKKGTLVPVCKRCETENFFRDGKNKKGLQRYRCKACGFRFVWSSDLPRRNFFSSIITFAVEMYTSPRVAASLRGVAQIIKKAFNQEASYEAIRQWTLASKKSISRRKKAISTHWHVDETYIKIKGKGHWLWVVYCADFKQVLAWHLSRVRALPHAVRVLKDALRVAGTRPIKITTDGLWQYPPAIKKVMGWHRREQNIRHDIHSGIGRNAVIERLNREIKRRIKWFSTFQSLRGALTFFALWFYHFNTQYLT